MHREQFLRSAHAQPRLRMLGNAAGAAMVVVGGALVIQTILNGPEARARLDHQIAVEIEEEDRAFCGQFGMEPGGEAFSSCSRELAQVRQRQAERYQRSLNFF